jgi:hypothetical protein
MKKGLVVGLPACLPAYLWCIIKDYVNKPSFGCTVAVALTIHSNILISVANSLASLLLEHAATLQHLVML